MADKMRPILCGIDVSQKTLDIAQAGASFVRIPNTREAINGWLALLSGPARIAVEATGLYHECLLEQALAAGHQIYMINGKQLHHYREAVGQRAKTDPDDARLLLRYLSHEQAALTPVKPLKDQEKRLWRLLQRRTKLVTVRGQLRQSLAGDSETLAIADELSAGLNEAITRVERLLTSLARELGWEAEIKRCQRIPGIGLLSALGLVACFNRGDFRRSDQWVAYMGLDVRVRDSGKSKGRRKLTKRGNPEIRRLLYNAAMSAVRTPNFKPVYERYRARGLSSTAAIVALSRKLARIAFALLSKKEEFDEKNLRMACA